MNIYTSISCPLLPNYFPDFLMSQGLTWNLDVIKKAVMKILSMRQMSYFLVVYRGHELRSVASRRGQSRGTSVMRSQSASENIHVVDTLRWYQLYPQSAPLPRTNIGDWILPAISANEPSFCNMFSTMESSKWKRRSPLRFWTTSKFVLGMPTKTSWKMDKMLSALGATVEQLPEVKEKLRLKTIAWFLSTQNCSTTWKMFPSA